MIGLEPRTPFSVSSSPVGLRPLPVGDYVKEMADVYESTLRFVRALRTEKVEKREMEVARRNRTSQAHVGDFMYVLRPQFLGAKVRPGEVSKKLMHRVYDDLYQVHHCLSDSSVILRRASDGAEPTDFKNPVNIERLIPAIPWYVAEPPGGAQKTVEVLQSDEATWRRANIVGYGYGGVVKVHYADEPADNFHWVDLTKEQYRWVV